jgi:hypothetical protein
MPPGQPVDGGVGMSATRISVAPAAAARKAIASSCRVTFPNTCSGERLAGQTVSVRVVLLAHGMAVVRMWVPFQTPASMDMAVVLAEEEIEGAGERCHERDVCQRTAHEVVAALRRPVNQVMQVGCNEHVARAYSPISDVPNTGSKRPTGR